MSHLNPATQMDAQAGGNSVRLSRPDGSSLTIEAMDAIMNGVGSRGDPLLQSLRARSAVDLALELYRQGEVSCRA